MPLCFTALPGHLVLDLGALPHGPLEHICKLPAPGKRTSQNNPLRHRRNDNGDTLPGKAGTLCKGPCDAPSPVLQNVGDDQSQVTGANFITGRHGRVNGGHHKGHRNHVQPKAQPAAAVDKSAVGAPVAILRSAVVMPSAVRGYRSLFCPLALRTW